MQTEDYIYQDDIAQSKYPLSKKHVLAIGVTAFLACSLHFVLPKTDSSHAKTPIFRIDGDNSSYEEILDPTRSLTDILLTDRHAVPASNSEVTQSENNNNQRVYTSSNIGALENYDEDIGDTIATTDESVLEKHINDLAGDEGSNIKEWTTEEIQRGDTLSSIFNDLNIPYNVMQAIANDSTSGRNATNLRPGNKVSFLFDQDNNLVEFVKQINADEQWHFIRKDVNTLTFEARREPVGSHVMVTNEDGTLKPLIDEDNLPAYKTRGRLVVASVGKGESFSVAAHEAGLTYSEIRQITDLFKGRVQFTRDIQPGDTMRVLFSDDRGEGKINAIEFKLKRVGTLSAYRNLADDKYYDEKGYNSSTSTFRRFPIDGKVVISSQFNPTRRHPVTGQVRPHNGTDFAVRVGTPVIAPADGVVELAKYSRSAGYYIIIRHRGSYTTVYMHLSKLLVQPGQRVKIGDVIARSGNTGISTGPHLHYELHQNGRPINAMRVTLPANEDSTISKKNRQRFASNVELFKKELYKDSLIAQKD